IFVFFASVLLIAVNFFIGGSLQQILIFSGCIYVFSFLVTYIIGRRFSKKIIDLAFKVEAMAAGNFNKKLAVKSRDEIGQLTTALNELRSRLKTGIAMDVSKDMEIGRAKTDFVSLASHQLRTPLSIIKWYVDYLIAGDAGDLDPEQDKYLREVYRSNERMIELVNALLDVSRIDVGTFSIEPEPTDIIERAEAALAKFKPEIRKKKIKLEKRFDKLPMINLDSRLTKMVFENILSNSIKYSSENGIVRINIKQAQANILIKITDSGCGIPREQQPKVFTKLFRAANAKKIESIGTGLGLYIVKAIVEKSGGKIWFESPSLELLLEEGQKGSDIPIDKRSRGTTFFITIPSKGMKKKPGIKKLSSLG
ncbi:MAG: HAMP domain-containing sensor histidine kinase, partial [Patescibacteria group bacterium]|nr:HAMP domain-containing sensor histidine kinase [Patescibacteria group bacterium]